MRILSITTSLSEDSTTLKLANKITAAATSAADDAGLSPETDHVNVRNLSSDLTDMALTGFCSENLEAAFAHVAESDVIVTVAPVYKVAPVGLHTLFWQLIDEKALANKPVLIGSTGGTPRHSMAGETVLRPMLSYLKGIVVPTTVFAATDDWGSVEGGRSLNARIAQASEELIGLAASLGGVAAAPHAGAEASSASTGEFGRPGARRNPSIDDEFNPEFITPFSQLLEG
ncbi:MULTISPECIES: NAD(P)H-dependent oxidoreductase [Brevibacterium]|uniref:FMN reductase n=2 Tax=Brevibacterium TaxID=1696 RepID=A0A1H1W1Z4_BRESA|nr:NAD(P)H-dependent oxidoreductase [Brevibacterium sandarakinum]SDS90740.1 FMN reductase [Brevibacterium sandarakinum]